MTTNLSDLVYQTHEHWLTNGPPADTVGGAGDFWMQLAKGATDDWQGDGTGKLPVRTDLPANVGNVYGGTSGVYALAGPPGGALFAVPAAEYWGAARFPHKLIAFLRRPDQLESGMTGVMEIMERVVKSWNFGMSSAIWGDGRGVYGKGDGAYSVGGSAITLKNAASSLHFTKGDKIRLVLEATVTAAAPGTLAAPEVGELTITGINTQTGVITVDEVISTAIPTAVNTAWVTKSVFHGSGDDARLHPTGVFGFLAENATAASAAFYGVTRSTNPEQLAGQRVEVSATASPWEICTTIMQRARRSGAQIDQIWIPNSQIAELMAELRSSQVVYRAANAGITDPSNLMMGVSGIGVEYGGMRATILDDRFLCDHTVAEADDRRYVAINSRNVRLKMPDPIGWKDYSGTGTLLQRDPSAQSQSAEYGMFGNYFVDNPLDQLVASPTVTA